MELDLKISRVTIGDITGQRIVSDYGPAIVNICSQEVKSLELALTAWKTWSELAFKKAMGKYCLGCTER